MTSNLVEISQPVAEWKELSKADSRFFYAGVLLKFKTNDTAGNFDKYALAVRIDGASIISFVGFDGGSWGFGSAMLPVESLYLQQPYTVSVDWLMNNFHYICNLEEGEKVMYCEEFIPIPVSES